MNTATALELFDVQNFGFLPFPSADEIVQRAILIVEKRSKDDLIFCASEMDFMLNVGLPDYCKGNGKSQEEIEEILCSPLKDRLHNVIRIEKFATDSLQCLANATWQEFIAAYVLSLIAVAILRLQGQCCNVDTSLDEYEMDVYQSPSILAFTEYFELVNYAKEALVVAEELITLESTVSDRVDKKISNRNTNAANVRHTPSNDLKNHFCCEYVLENWDSCPDVDTLAQRFCQDVLTPEQFRVICPTNKMENAVRTLKRAMSKTICLIT